MKIRGLEGRVSSVLVGSGKSMETFHVPDVTVNLEGFDGDKHWGFTRLSGAREPWYPRKTEIRNDRQWSAVSTEELDAIAQAMGIPHIDPGWVGANVAFASIPNLTQLPRGTTLWFPEDAVLLVEGENAPCAHPGELIAQKCPELVGKPNMFPKAAIGRRGLVGVVQHAGRISFQDIVIVQIHTPKIFSIPPGVALAKYTVGKK